MIQFRDFVPRMLSAPAFFKVGEYETGCRQTKLSEKLGTFEEW